jgi:hypothetical protein
VRVPVLGRGQVQASGLMVAELAAWGLLVVAELAAWGLLVVVELLLLLLLLVVLLQVVVVELWQLEHSGQAPAVAPPLVSA